jgi:hypothetical protein
VADKAADPVVKGVAREVEAREDARYRSVP